MELDLDNTISRYSYNRITTPLFLSQNNFPEKKTDLIGNPINGTTCHEISFPSLGLYLEKRKINGVTLNQFKPESKLNKEILRDITRLILFKTLKNRLPQILQEAIIKQKNDQHQKEQGLHELNTLLEEDNIHMLFTKFFPGIAYQEKKMVLLQLSMVNTSNQMRETILRIKKTNLKKEIKDTILDNIAEWESYTPKEQLIFKDLAEKTVQSLSPALLEHIFFLTKKEQNNVYKTIIDICSTYYSLTTCFDTIEELINHVTLFAPPASVGWYIHDIPSSDTFPAVEVCIQAAAHGESGSDLIHTICDKFESTKNTLAKYKVECNCAMQEKNNNLPAATLLSLQI